MTEFKFIRAKNRVYERVEGTTRFTLLAEHKSISAAKRTTNDLEKKLRGSVRRRETLEKTMGSKAVKEMLNEP